MLVLNIAASLLAFYSFIKFLDDAVMWFGRFAGEDELSFSYILGYILYPVAFLIGIDPQVATQKYLIVQIQTVFNVYMVLVFLRTKSKS